MPISFGSPMASLFTSFLNTSAHISNRNSHKQMALLHRVFNLHLSKPPVPISTLTHEQRTILQECILHIRAEITTLQDRINISFSNISTIVRCINSIITHLHWNFYIHRYGITQQELQNVILVLGEKYARKPYKSSLTQQFANPALEALATRGEAALMCKSPAKTQMLKQKSKLELKKNSAFSFPFSLASADFMSMVSEEGRLNAELNVLVLKRAEMAIEADRLEGDLAFWGSVWEDIGCAVKVSRAKELDRELEVRLAEGRLRRCDVVKKHILRKEVPIREMLKRVAESRLPQQKVYPVLGRCDSGIAFEMEEEGEERYIDCIA